MSGHLPIHGHAATGTRTDAMTDGRGGTIRVATAGLGRQPVANLTGSLSCRDPAGTCVPGLQALCQGRAAQRLHHHGRRPSIQDKFCQDERRPVMVLTGMRFTVAG